MGKNPNTFAKRQREMEKKRKAEEKRTRRRERKENPGPPDDGVVEYDEDGNVIEAVVEDNVTEEST